jgi:hypothetical protein
MVRIEGNEGNTIYYSCDCGTEGKCMVRPVGKSKAILVDVGCPVCFERERVVLLQYDTDEERDKLLKNLNEEELSWSLILSNEVTKRGG